MSVLQCYSATENSIILPCHRERSVAISTQEIANSLFNVLKLFLLGTDH